MKAAPIRINWISESSLGDSRVRTIANCLGVFHWASCYLFSTTTLFQLILYKQRPTHRENHGSLPSFGNVECSQDPKAPNFLAWHSRPAQYDPIQLASPAPMQTSPKCSKTQPRDLLDLPSVPDALHFHAGNILALPFLPLTKLYSPFSASSALIVTPPCLCSFHSFSMSCVFLQFFLLYLGVVMLGDTRGREWGK